MIAKLVVWGETRNEAIERMKQAISDYRIVGFATTLSFGEFVMNHPKFVSADFDTQFVQNYFGKEDVKSSNETESKAAALLALRLLKDATRPVVAKNKRDSDWYTARRTIS